MNKRGNSTFITGIILVVIGFFVSVGLFYTRCITRESSGMYDLGHMNQCVSEPITWTLFAIGAIIATIGGFMCQGSNR